MYVEEEFGSRAEDLNPMIDLLSLEICFQVTKPVLTWE